MSEMPEVPPLDISWTSRGPAASALTPAGMAEAAGAGLCSHVGSMLSTCVVGVAVGGTATMFSCEYPKDELDILRAAKGNVEV